MGILVIFKRLNRMITSLFHLPENLITKTKKSDKFFKKKPNSLIKK